MGTEGFTGASLHAKAEEARRLTQAVADLPALVGSEWPGAQVAFQLLRQCANQQLSHLLRTTPPEVVREEMEHFDAEVELAAEKVAGLEPLTDAEKAQLGPRC